MKIEIENCRFPKIIQELVESILPEDFYLEASSHRLLKSLPLFLTHCNKEEASFTMTYLTPADYTSGSRRYVADMLTRWLIPEEPLQTLGSISSYFTFKHCQAQRFYIAQETLKIDREENWNIIQTTLPSLIQEMKTNIQAVYHARYIASLKSISLEEKNKIIQENLSSLLQLPSTEVDRTLHDQMQGFLHKLTAEKKIDQVKKNIAYLRQSRPKAFDRDLFYEMTHFTVLFRDQFSSHRQARHITRVIALHYLFKKTLQDAIQKNPSIRHLNIKLFKTTLLNSKQILGLLIGITLLKDGMEQIDKKELVDAIRTIVPDASYFPDSFIADRRDDKLRLFYLEIQKPTFAPFTPDEIRSLRKDLPNEIKKQIENRVHPIFMPRNEEELLRNLIILTKQLKYVRDLPQVSIHYEKQTHSEISFTVLLARLILKKDPSLKTLFPNKDHTFHFSIDETRIMGSLKNKLMKEGAIIRANLKKSLFFRQDYSVDLLRARQKVVTELSRIIGEFRDYNGGMILKQDESLDLLRKAVGLMTEDQEFLLENYFYSLRPGIMQTVHDPLILKIHFNLLLDLVRQDLTEEVCSLKSAQSGKFFLYFLGAVAPSFNDYTINAIEKLKIPSYELTTTQLQVHELSTIGFILRSNHPPSSFEATLLESLHSWKSHFSCPVPRT